MLTDTTRLNLTRYLVGAAMAATFALAPRLWLADPFFGSVPVFDALPRITAPFDQIAFWLLVALLVPVLATRRPQRWTLLFCIALAMRCIWDRMMWQPYLLQYFFMLLAMASTGPPKRPPATAAALDTTRLIVVSVYLWSGISKFNYAFLDYGMAGILVPLFGEATSAQLHRGVIAIPVLETLVAIGLLTRRWRRLAVVGALLTHVSILGLLGPLGLDYNRVVWPWNLMMIAVVTLLFWSAKEPTPRRILGFGSGLVHKVVVVFFVVCPALSLFGLWNDYLSFRLYASHYAIGKIMVTPRLLEQLPESARAVYVKSPSRPFTGFVTIPHWSEKELGAFAPPSEPIYLHVARRLIAQVRAKSDVVLQIEGRPEWLTGSKSVRRLSSRDLR